MTIMLSIPELTELKPKITVFGVGGAGGNAVNNMINSGLQGVEFVAANTDAQALAQSLADQRIQLGVKITQGLGAGSQPSVGRAAAEEALEVIDEHLTECHMVFITAGMGGGTGTGAAPIIAKLARERGILTVGVVTKPFQFEGGRRMTVADTGIGELQDQVDTLIIIPNQNLFRVANEKTTFAGAFAMADEVLHSGVRGITDLMVNPGLINLDFADVRAVMNEMGKAMMGTGEAEGEDRATQAALAAISNPLLDDVSMKGAKGVIINITGGEDLTLFEVDAAANQIRGQVDSEANIIVGSAFNEALNGKIRVSVVATGIESAGEEGYRRPEQQTAVFRAFERQIISSEPPVFDVAETEPLELSDAIEDDSSEGEPEAEEELEADLEAQTSIESAVEAAADAIDRANEELAGDDEPFIAEEPVVPAREGSFTRSPPDPFAEAAIENAHVGGAEPEPAEVVEQPSVPQRGRREPADPRGPSLFERMAGSLFSEKEIGGEAPPVEPQKENETQTGGAALGRIDPADRPAPAAVSDDKLEIPSFLRRQMN